MPSIELTENLRSTIRDLRKKKKKRGDELSKELGKGASYISQIENGKIKEIDFDLLSSIFVDKRHQEGLEKLKNFKFKRHDKYNLPEELL